MGRCERDSGRIRSFMPRRLSRLLALISPTEEKGAEKSDKGTGGIRELRARPSLIESSTEPTGARVEGYIEGGRTFTQRPPVETRDCLLDCCVACERDLGEELRQKPRAAKTPGGGTLENHQVLVQT